MVNSPSLWYSKTISIEVIIMYLIPKTYKEVIYYILVPLFIVLMIFGFILFLTNRKKDKNNDVEYTYKVNYWSSVIGIIFGAMLFAVSIGFCVLFIQRLHLYELADKFSVLVVFLFIFPFIPLAFLIYFIIKFINTLRLKFKMNYHKTSLSTTPVSRE